MKRILPFLFALLVSLPAVAQSVVTTDNVRAELISEVATVKAGEPFWVALRQTIKPRWHTYWKNPGDSGLPTEIAWTLPQGAKADPIVWPTPSFIDVGGIINYGFHDDILLLIKASITTKPDKREGRRVFRDSGGNIVMHFPPEDDPAAHQALKARLYFVDPILEDRI